MAAMRSLGLDAVRQIELSENVDASIASSIWTRGRRSMPTPSTTLAGTDGLRG